MKILVTGAAGYIGSQTCKTLKAQGNYVVGVDRNSPKHSYYDEFHNANYNDIQALLLNVDEVVHIAATSLVGPSVINPSEYYKNNVDGTRQLLDDCVVQGVKKIVFASSAACYGNPESGICTIEDGNTPMNPYGWSKRMTEIMLSDYKKAYGLDSVSLRFFNVAGADTDGEMGQEKAATHIIARVIEAGLSGETFTLYGNYFDTEDGSCVRDYIHVEDIATAISSSLDMLLSNPGAHVLNLGSGTGYSNLEIIEAVNNLTPLNVQYVVGPVREGDPDKLVADTTSAKELINFKTNRSLDNIINTAYNWYIR